MTATSSRGQRQAPGVSGIPHTLLLLLLLCTRYPCSRARELRCGSVGGYNERVKVDCPVGQYVAYLDYVGLGDATGTCDSQVFLDGKCMRTNAMAAVESLCLGKESCSTSVNETLSMIAANEMSGATTVPIQASECQTSMASPSLKMKWGCERDGYTQGLAGCNMPTCAGRCNVNGGQPLCDDAGNVAIMEDGSSELCFCDKGCVQRADCCDGALGTCSPAWSRPPPASCGDHGDCGVTEYCTTSSTCESCAGCFPAKGPKNSITEECPAKCAGMNQACDNGVLSAHIEASDGFQDDAGVFSGNVCCPAGCSVCGGDNCDAGRGAEWPRYPNGYRCCVASYFKSGPKPAGEPLSPGELVTGYFTWRSDPGICVDQNATACKLP
eukprot:gene14477-24984_t